MDLLPLVMDLGILAVAVVLHEVGHGVVANRCGDPTAAEQGRLTLNPLRHIDPVGTLLVPGFLLSAWAMGVHPLCVRLGEARAVDPGACAGATARPWRSSRSPARSPTSRSAAWCRASGPASAWASRALFVRVTAGWRSARTSLGVLNLCRSWAARRRPRADVACRAWARALYARLEPFGLV
jgi:hypothetical protein